MLAEFRLGVALGGDDVADAELGREPDGLDDLVGAIEVGRRRIEEVGVSAEGSEFDAGLGGPLANLRRMAVEADGGRETVLHPKHAALMVVG